MATPGFKIDENKGFKITFANGITVSVQFGNGNYCNNRTIRPRIGNYSKGQECINAEVSIWDKNGKWITREYDSNIIDVFIDYCLPAELLKILVWAEVYKEMTIRF